MAGHVSFLAPYRQEEENCGDDDTGDQARNNAHPEVHPEFAHSQRSFHVLEPTRQPHRGGVPAKRSGPALEIAPQATYRDCIHERVTY
jgi:hypothetical protein